MMNHAISDYFHFDHQFFHTLKPLLFKPGKLTNEYMAGKRVQYLHPVKMYIFISLVYFLLLFQSGFEPVKVNQTHNGKPTKKEIAANAKELDKVLKDPNVPGFAKKLVAKEKAKLDTSGKGIVKITESDDIDIDDSGVHGKITRLPWFKPGFYL
ncbi:DUF3667 domain-containing protein [Mucilaginibacter sp. S1162]|uniref:DUF3667 domain-containing protein n=1 Tax=Mucilaginibacter humi TaxID=2732510 RepID=A0ABX1VZL3_9SPHI|nr:DUF3667 domain-containing protein [Mucilaginibacter humi]NNU33074.1 DUF3667 domain-containing protein [Mucilaginibacter humi]